MLVAVIEERQAVQDENVGAECIAPAALELRGVWGLRSELR